MVVEFEGAVMPVRYCLMFFTLSGAGYCAYIGTLEYEMSARSSREPEEISLRELITRGPGGNPNIILTDFSIFNDFIVEKKLGSTRWTKVWVPIVPTTNDERPAGQPAAIRAFLFSDTIGSDAELRGRCDRPKLRGMIRSDESKPGIMAGALIMKSYPGTNARTCIIIEEGKQPASALTLSTYGLGCAFLLLISGCIWLLARHLDRFGEEQKRVDETHPHRRRRVDEA